MNELINERTIPLSCFSRTQGLCCRNNLWSVNRPAVDTRINLSFLSLHSGKHGVGRIDIVENRFIGMKSRGMKSLWLSWWCRWYFFRGRREWHMLMVLGEGGLFWIWYSGPYGPIDAICGGLVFLKKNQWHHWAWSFGTLPKWCLAHCSSPVMPWAWNGSTIQQPTVHPSWLYLLGSTSLSKIYIDNGISPGWSPMISKGFWS